MLSGSRSAASTESPKRPVITVIAKRSHGSGNLSTADRIGQYLIAAGYEVVNVDACAPPAHAPGCAGAEAEIARHRSDMGCAVGLHAYHAGRWLAERKAGTYVLIFGGTDVYSDDYRQESRLLFMAETVRKAAVLVAFTAHMRDTAATLFDVSPDRIHVIPQAVRRVAPDPTFFLARLPVWATGAHPPDHLFLLPAGLRPVKDVLFLAETFEDWHHRDPGVGLLILGDDVDVDYATFVRKSIALSSAVWWHPAVPQPALFQAFTQCRAVVNTSVSEGQCGAVLEAMSFGVPILARSNSGNNAMLQHDVSCVAQSATIRSSRGSL